MNKLFHAAASSLSASTLLCGAVQADEAALFACINKYKEVGISADAALTQCNKNSLAECIKGLVGTKYKAYAMESVSHETRKSRKQSGSSEKGRLPDKDLRKSGYLIDLGNVDNRWMEGKGWEDLGCIAHTDGPYKRQSDLRTSGLFGNQGRSYEWFRQGWCSTSSIELSQPYGSDDAKRQCEMEALGISKDKL